MDSREDAPDYDGYTLDELLDVERNIDRERYPERYQEVLAQIARRRAGEGPGALLTPEQRRERDRAAEMVGPDTVTPPSGDPLGDAAGVTAPPESYAAGGAGHAKPRSRRRLVLVWLVGSVAILAAVAVIVMPRMMDMVTPLLGVHEALQEEFPGQEILINQNTATGIGTRLQIAFTAASWEGSSEETRRELAERAARVAHDAHPGIDQVDTIVVELRTRIGGNVAERIDTVATYSFTPAQLRADPSPAPSP